MIVNEEEYLRKVPRHVYLTTEEVQAISEFFDIKILILDKNDPIQCQNMTLEAIKEIGGVDADQYSANGAVLIGKEAEIIAVKADFGKYTPTGILFHEIGHWLEYVQVYGRSVMLMAKESLINKMAFEDVAHDLCESRAWAYGSLAALYMDQHTGSKYFYPCLEQINHEAISGAKEETRLTALLSYLLIGCSSYLINTLCDLIGMSRKLAGVLKDEAVSIDEYGKSLFRWLLDGRTGCIGQDNPEIEKWEN